ncbi:MAG: NUDIX domain-containing protein [Candidatus Saccharimonadales bacterium]
MRQAARAIVIKDDKLLVIHRNKFGKEYYTLPGGGIDSGETPEQAIIREMDEETGVVIALKRLVFIEEPGEPFGRQYIFLAEYVSGEPALHPNSEEAALNLKGQNTYLPLWLELTDLDRAVFMSPILQRAILNGVQDGFPATAEPL